MIARPRELARYSGDRRRPAWVGDDAPFRGRSLARCWTRKGRAEDPVEPLLMEAGKPPGLTNQGREPVAKGPMKG